MVTSKTPKKKAAPRKKAPAKKSYTCRTCGPNPGRRARPGSLYPSGGSGRRRASRGGIGSCRCGERGSSVARSQEGTRNQERGCITEASPTTSSPEEPARRETCSRTGKARKEGGPASARARTQGGSGRHRHPEPIPELARRVAATAELRLPFDHAIPDQLGF